MIIKDVRIRPLYCKFKQPYVWALGADLGQHIVLIEIETENGIIGIGETAPTMMNVYSVLSFLESVRPILVGRKPVFEISSLMETDFRTQLWTGNCKPIASSGCQSGFRWC